MKIRKNLIINCYANGVKKRIIPKIDQLSIKTGFPLDCNKARTDFNFLLYDEGFGK